jgi:4-hydroxybenzoate polyprenyltransferase
MIAIRYGLIYPFLKIYHIDFELSLLNFVLLVASTVFIAAGGYVINDYFDRKIDMENKPDKVVVGTHIESRRVMSLHNAFTAIGLILGFYVSFDLDRNSFSIIFIIISGALWFYSTLYKRHLLVGNLLIALLTAVVPLLVLLYDVPLLLEKYQLVFLSKPEVYKEIQYMMYSVVLFAGFAFLTTLVREIIKDIQDMEGDCECYRVTIPIAWGVTAAKIISSVLTLVTIGALWFIYYIFLQNDIWSLLYVSIVLTLPLLILIVMLIKSDSPKAYGRVSNLLKIIMVLGLLYVVPFYFYVTAGV